MPAEASNIRGRDSEEFSTYNFSLLQVERVEELVSGGSPDISYMDNDKRSPLHAAAFVGNCEIVEILIEHVSNGRTSEKQNFVV